MEITQEQRTKIKKVAKLVDFESKGAVSLLEDIFELGDMYDKDIPELRELIEELKKERPDRDEIKEMVDEIVNGIEIRTPKDGEDYVLTEDDKKEIASLIEVPRPKPDVIIEKYNTETIIKEQPIEIIKEVAVITDNEITSRGEAIRDGLELLQGEERLDKKAIKGLDDYDEIARLAKTSGTRTFPVGGNRDLQQVTDMGATTTNAVSILNTLKVKQATTNAVIIGDVTGNARGSGALDLQSSRASVTNVASGTKSIAIGTSNTASANYAFALGNQNLALVSFSSAFGYGNMVLAYAATGLGFNNTASGDYSTASGYANTASAYSASAFGYSNLALGIRSSAMGYQNTASANYCIASGYGNTASGYNSTALGISNYVSGNYSSALGYANNTSQYFSNAVGISNSASGYQSAAFGYGNTASANYTTAFGYFSNASGAYSVALGANAQATANGSLAIGSGTSSGYYESDLRTRATGTNSVSVGTNSGYYGTANTASGQYASSFGVGNSASGTNSTAVGYGNNVSVDGSSAFGASNTIWGTGSSAFGFNNSVSSNTASVFGYNNTVSATTSATLGLSITNITANTVEIGASNAGKIQLSSTYLRPFTDNQKTLGGITNRWTTIYGSGGLMLGYAAKTANYTLTATDYLVNCTANTFTITLPTAVAITGQIFIIKNSGTGIITLATTSSQTIDGVASGILTLVQWDSITVTSNGANWIITN